MLDLVAVDALYDEMQDDTPLAKALPSAHFTKLEPLRAVYELLDQERSKEFESMWIDEQQRYESATSMNSSQILNRSSIASADGHLEQQQKLIDNKQVADEIDDELPNEQSQSIIDDETNIGAQNDTIIDEQGVNERNKLFETPNKALNSENKSQLALEPQFDISEKDEAEAEAQVTAGHQEGEVQEERI